jgi:S-adenosylhomocysteine hydrolase
VIDELQFDLQTAAQLQAKASILLGSPTLNIARHRQWKIEEERCRQEDEQEIPAREVKDSLFLRTESAPALQTTVRSDAFQRVSSAGCGQLNKEDDERAALRALVLRV